MGSKRGKYRKELTEVQRLMIDEYFINGYDSTLAYLKYNPDVTEATARKQMTKLMRAEVAQPYLDSRRQRIKALTEIDEHFIINKLKAAANVDPTQLVGLSDEELKSLPLHVRQAIQSIDIKEVTRTTRNGETTTRTIKINTSDKMKALNMLAKHVNLYNANNKSKASTTNILNNIDADTLNVLIQAKQQIEE